MVKLSKMRLFTAIDLPDEIKNYLYEIQNSIKKEKIADARWVFKKNLHITLKFLGEIPEDKIEIIKSAISEVKIHSFKLRLIHLETFPSINEPIGNISVIWVGAEPQAPIIELQKLIDEQTINYEGIKLGAHITLARVKKIKNKKAFIRKIKNINVKEMQFEVNSFNLYKSTLRKDGPSYELVKEYKLL